MSQRDVERALGRLVTDERFRHKFFEVPAEASLSLGLQLTAQEVEALLRTSRTALARLGDGLDDRICRLQAPSVAVLARNPTNGP